MTWISTGDIAPQAAQNETMAEREVLLLLLVAVVTVVVIAALVLQEKWRIRVAGISESRPACPRCFYPLGGWGSSRCPECGCDIRVEGARIGGREHRLLGMIGLGLAIVVLDAVVLNALPNWFRQERGEYDATMSPAKGPAYRVRITAVGTWPYMFERQRVNINLTFSGSSSNATVPRIDDESSIPTVESLASSIATTSSSAVDANVREQAAVLRNILLEPYQKMDRAEFRRMMQGSWMDELQDWSRGSSHRFETQTMPWVQGAFLLLSILVTLPVMVFAYRRLPGGTRPAMEDEWLHVPLYMRPTP
jgi:hypothetical protein